MKDRHWDTLINVLIKACLLVVGLCVLSLGCP
jgi:hypothetical protein